MKKRYLIGILIGIVIIVAATVLLWPKQEFKWTRPEQMQYERTLVVAADKDYPPYSFIGESGEYEGHDVELIYALGAELGVNIDLHLVPWTEALDGIKNGEYDLLLGVTYAENRLDDMIFSIPVVSDPYVTFGRKADGDTAALSEKCLCTIRGDSATESFLLPYGFKKNSTYFDTYSECFASVASGENDYVICPYLTGIKITEEYPEIKAVGAELYNSIYCICAPLGRETLRDEVNTALEELSSSGILSEIHDRWLVDYVKDTSLKAFLIENQNTLIIFVLVLMILVFAVYYFLERRNMRKLYIQTERVRIFEETLEAPLFEYTLAKDTMVFSVKESDGQVRRERMEHFLRDGKINAFVDEKNRSTAVSLLFGKEFSHGKATLECRLKWKEQPLTWYRITLREVRSMAGSMVSIVGRLENIDRTAKERDEALRLASIDQLTGLENRAAFQKMVEARLQIPVQGFRTLIMLDMDDFKAINDTFGHTVGDRVLVEAGNLLQRVFGADDVIARFGGDEFLVYMECLEKDVIVKRIEQLQFRLRNLDQQVKNSGCSIGAVFSTGGTLPAVEQIIEAADKALYESKRKGKNCYTLHML